MKRSLFIGFAMLALVLGACNQESTVNGPVAPQDNNAFVTYAQQLDLTSAQTAEVIEMFYLGEDMTAIMSTSQATAFEGFVGSVTPTDERGKFDPRRYLDVEAMMFLRLVFKANPDMTDEQKKELSALVAEYNKKRMEVIANAEMTPEQKLEALKVLHEELMGKLVGPNGEGGLILADQIKNAKDLAAKIEAERKEYQEKMLELRIQKQILMWDRMLQLNAEQEGKIKDILKEQDRLIKEAQEKYKGQPELFRLEVLSIQKKTNEAIRSTLDDKQKVLWDRLMKGRLGTGSGGGRTGGGVIGTRG